MSDQSQGPGWWEASDHRWYPPETHPDSLPPGFGAPRRRHALPKPPVYRRLWFIVASAAALIVMVFAAVRSPGRKPSALSIRRGPRGHVDHRGRDSGHWEWPSHERSGGGPGLGPRHGLQPAWAHERTNASDECRHDGPFDDRRDITDLDNGAASAATVSDSGAQDGPGHDVPSAGGRGGVPCHDRRPRPRGWRLGHRHRDLKPAGQIWDGDDALHEHESRLRHSHRRGRRGFAHLPDRPSGGRPQGRRDRCPRGRDLLNQLHAPLVGRNEMASGRLGVSGCQHDEGNLPAEGGCLLLIAAQAAV